MDDEARRQLAALADVTRALDGQGIEHWLFGGWAVDFYVGSVTRRHDDVDFAVWLADAEQIGRLLTEAGWRHAPDPDEDGGTGYERDGVRVELSFLVHDGAEVMLPLRGGSILWPYEDHEDVGELNGVRARVVSLGSLIAGKSFGRDDPDDRSKDRADLIALQSVRE